MSKSLAFALFLFAILGVFGGHRLARACHVAVIAVTVLGYMGIWARVVPW